MTYVIELKRTELQKERGQNHTVYTTENYEIKDGFVFFEDKFQKEMVINLEEVSKIREIL